MKKNLVAVEIEERTALERLLSKGKVAGGKMLHARILLPADALNARSLAADIVDSLS